MNLLDSLKSAGQWVLDKLSGGKQTTPQQTQSTSSTGQFIGQGPSVYNQQQAGMYQPGFQGPIPQPQGTLPPPGGGDGGGGGGGGGPTPPPYAPNVVNQTVSFGGATWKGNPGTGWTLQGGGSQGESLADSLLGVVTNVGMAAIEEQSKKLAEFDRNNPFVFDEALVRAGSESNINPYYIKTLDEFMQGVRASSRRSVEDMTRTIGELNVDASKLSEKERLSTQEAIRSSEEGFAGAGLFFSGVRQRQTGLQEVQSVQNQEGIETKLGRDISSQKLSNTRWQEDLALKEAHQKWTTEAERKTALEVDIAKKKKEQELQHGLERFQFAGRLAGQTPFDIMKTENQYLSGLQ